MVTLINGLGIYKNIYSKEPINNETQSFSNFSIDFKQIAKRNKKFILGGKIDKGVTYKDLNKKSFPCWRPNAIYGNRANSINTDRIIMGSGLFFFDIDFKKEINLDNNYREEIRKLDSLLNGYKEHLLLNFKESIVALYKSISRTGLHLVFEGVTTPDADEFKKAWYIYKAYLEKNFKYLKDYIDLNACNINRASYIGSDDNPFLNDDKVMIPLVLDETKELKQVTMIQRNFAKVQCNVKTNIVEQGRRIHSYIDSMDISESNIIYIAENYNTEINLDVNGKKEKRTLIAYVVELGIPLLFPENYIHGSIKIGRRNNTITRLTANYLYLNGYNLLDNVQLLKWFFRNHIYPKMEQSPTHKYTLEDMYKNIESSLKAKLLPRSVDLRDRRCFVLNISDKLKLGQRESINISRKYRKTIRLRRTKLIIDVLLKLHKYDKISLKKLYTDGKWLFQKICALHNYGNFRTFCKRGGITVTSLYNTNKYISCDFKYTGVKHIKDKKALYIKEPTKYTDV